MSRGLNNPALLGLAGFTGLLLASAPTTARADDDIFAGVSYHNAIGVDETYDFTPGYSFRGLGFDVRYIPEGSFSAGLAVAWHVLADDSRDQVRVENVDISGRQRRSFNAVPILAMGHYYTEGPVRLMLGFGLGASWIERRVEVGLFDVDEDYMHFTVAPEVGLIVRPWENTWVLLSSRYHYAAETGGAPAHQWFSFGLGLGGRM